MPKTKKKRERCPVCHKLFYNLKAHMVVHEKEKNKNKKDKEKKESSKKSSGDKKKKTVSKETKKVSSGNKRKKVSTGKKSTKKRRASTGKSSKSRRPRSKSNQGITNIKVIGVGGAGGNIISRMRNSNRIRGVEYIAVNTDMQDLEEVSAHKKIHIGRALTKGMGAGMNPDIGRQAVEENRSEIGEIIKGADIVFIAAGFGGGTGSGAAPVIAEIAKEAGVLTIGIVTRPFKFEGSKRMMIAQEAIDRIRENVDALVTIPNDRVFAVIDKDTSILKAFAYVDDVLKDGVGAIADLINVPGIINVDFSDIRTILKDMGTSMIGVGLAKGQDRSTKVIQQAVNSPLLETSIEGAKGVLFSIAGGRDLKMSEVNDIAKVISDSLDPNAQVIFGAINDNSLKDKAIKLTVIATGFNGALRDNNSFNMPHLFSRDEKRKSSFEINSLKADKDLDEESDVEEENPFSNHPSGSSWESKGGLDEDGDDDSKSSPWDVPTFLRKKKKK